MPNTIDSCTLFVKKKNSEKSMNIMNVANLFKKLDIKIVKFKESGCFVTFISKSETRRGLSRQETEFNKQNYSIITMEQKREIAKKNNKRKELASSSNSYQDNHQQQISEIIINSSVIDNSNREIQPPTKKPKA